MTDTQPDSPARDQIAAAIRDFPFDDYGLDNLSYALEDDPDAQEWVPALAAAVLDVVLPLTSTTAVLARDSDAAVQRVTSLYEQWVKAGPPPIGAPLARWWYKRLVELHNAILPPAPRRQAGCPCHNGDELCSGCHRCPDFCQGCDGPEYQPTDQPQEK